MQNENLNANTSTKTSKKTLWKYSTRSNCDKISKFGVQIKCGCFVSPMDESGYPMKLCRDITSDLDLISILLVIFLQCFIGYQDSPT